MYARQSFCTQSLWALVTWWVCSAALDHACAEDSSVKTRFLNQYPEALKALEKRFSAVQGAGTLTNQTNAGGKTSVSTTYFRFQVEGKALKVAEYAAPTGRDKPLDFKRSRGANSDYVFVADRKAGTSVLRQFKPDGENARDYAMMNQFRRDFIEAPLVCLIPISHLLQKETTKIGEVSSLTRDGHSFIKAEYSRVIQLKKNSVPATGWLLLAPDEGWLMYECEERAGQGFRRTNIEYGPPIDGIPVPKRVTITSSHVKRVFVYDEFEFRPSDPADFRLTSVGLPEIATRNTQGRAWLWLINSALVAAIIAALLYRKWARGASWNSGKPKSSEPN